MQQSAVVIADDLTGANDTAVQYRKNGVASIVNVGPAEQYGPNYFKGYDLISVNTDSRAMSPVGAYNTVYNACKIFCLGNSNHIYKKLDSMLRGNPGPELDAVMDASGFELAFVAPSYPDNDRVVKNGILTTNTQKIDALKSISSDMKRRTCNVPISVVRSGLQNMAEFIESNRNSGNSVFIFDAETDGDLMLIYALSAKYKDKCILCGSAGFAKFDAISYTASKTKTINTPNRNGIVLVVTSSRSIETREQVRNASMEFGVECITMDKELVASHKGELAVNSVLEQVEKQAKQNKGVVIIAISSLFEDFQMVLRDSDKNYRMAHELSKKLGEIVESIFKMLPVKGVVACGGDTTMQICRKLGIYGIEPLTEILSGVPAGILKGGTMDGLPVVTKSGGFGSKNVISDSVKFLQNYGNT